MNLPRITVFCPLSDLFCSPSCFTCGRVRARAWDCVCAHAPKGTSYLRLELFLELLYLRVRVVLDQPACVL